MTGAFSLAVGTSSPFGIALLALAAAIKTFADMARTASPNRYASFETSWEVVKAKVGGTFLPLVDFGTRLNQAFSNAWGHSAGGPKTSIEEAADFLGLPKALPSMKDMPAARFSGYSEYADSLMAAGAISGTQEGELMKEQLSNLQTIAANTAGLSDSFDAFMRNREEPFRAQ